MRSSLAIPASSSDVVSGPIAIGPYQTGDEVSICGLFARVFGRPKTVEHWRWQFLESGGVPHVFVARTAGGEVVGQFACVPRRMQVGGDRLTFSQSVDSMIDPAHRGGLKRPGLFTEVVKRYVEHYGRVEHEAFGYGLPNDEAYRIGRRFLGYTHLTDVRLWVRNISRSGRDETRAEVEVTRTPPRDHDLLWARASLRFSLVAIRDERFLQWRYVRSPVASYQFVSVRRRGALECVLVYAASCFEPRCATLVDVIWDGADESVLASGVRATEQLASRHDREYLVTLLPGGSREQVLLAASGYDPVAFELPLVGRSYHPPLTLDWVRQHWWYTFGDFDLV